MQFVRHIVAALIGAAWMFFTGAVLIDTCTSVSQEQRQHAGQQRTSSSDRNSVVPTRPEPVSQIPAQSPNREPSNGEYEADRSNCRMELSSIAIVLLTAVIAFAAIRTWLVYRDIHRASMVIERAYVTMSHEPPGIEFGVGRSGAGAIPTTSEVTISVRIRNYGNTPARITYTLLQPHFGAGPLPVTPHYDDQFGETIGMFLVKDDYFIIKKHWYLPDQDISWVRAVGPTFFPEPQRLWIFGYVDYIDRFQVRHRAGYARVFDPIADKVETYTKPDPSITSVALAGVRIPDPDAYDRRNNLPIVTQPRYNYDRERKQGDGKDWDEPQQ